MIYNELIINESIWNILTSYISNQKMPHSMIFHGINGTGKEAHAIEFSALLNCENTKNKQACGACASCQQIKKMQNPQIKIITPLPRGKINSIKSASLNALTDKEIKELNEMKLKKGKNPYYHIHIKNARTILINSIREIKKEIYLSNTNPGYNIIMILNAEKLCYPNTESANALLKILEEPPDKTLFILVTSKINMLLDTIISRCQTYYFKPLKNDEVFNYLINKNYQENEIEESLQLANGSISKAIKYIDNIKSIRDTIKLQLDTYFNPYNSNFDTITNKIKTIKSDENELIDFFNIGQLLFKDIFYLKNNLNSKITFNQYLEQLTIYKNKYPNANWFKCINILEETLSNILYNGYISLTITNMLIELHTNIERD